MPMNHLVRALHECGCGCWLVLAFVLAHPSRDGTAQRMGHPNLLLVQRMERQIPYRNDRKKGKGKSKSNDKGKSRRKSKSTATATAEVDVSFFTSQANGLVGGCFGYGFLK
jgi:hypothetical protein